MKRVPVRAKLYRAIEPGTMVLHAVESLEATTPTKASQAQARGPKPTKRQASPPGEEAPHHEDRRRTATKNQTKARQPEQEAKPSQTRQKKKQDNQDKADERKPAKARPEPATQHKQGKANKPKASQNKARGWETAGVRASPRWFATARSRQKPAKPGERQLCRPDPSITQKPPTPASSMNVSASGPSRQRASATAESVVGARGWVVKNLLRR